ncbi:hypothetical protein Bhyg_11539 [Pseudolycoriella hygida]|uniref:Uncharacterized protein n=1 Tax=Pseudolycoriella hygida TaxID=35572 RepID=A0A9Q0MVL9_9DIPT|nr:hypothetical protein Bhyg_11539 [Pseudolycoriella hygida]
MAWCKNVNNLKAEFNFQKIMRFLDIFLVRMLRSITIFNLIQSQIAIEIDNIDKIVFGNNKAEVFALRQLSFNLQEDSTSKHMEKLKQLEIVLLNTKTVMLLIAKIFEKKREKMSDIN